MKDKPGSALKLYKFEWACFWNLYDDTPILEPHARRSIDLIYEKFAPNRKRPELKLLDVAPARRREMGTAAYYVPGYHRITSTLLVLNECYLTHEVVHSLSERDTWAAHGPEFTRNLIEVHCWRLQMAVKPRVRLARNFYRLPVADTFRLGRDPAR